MNGRATEVFFDDELVELLATEPELLAVADAIAETQQRGLPQTWLSRAGIAAVAAAAIVGLLVSAPWQHRHAPSLVDRALAAVGTGPIIHAVIETETGMTSVDLATEEERPVAATMELWFDQDRRIEHTLSRIDGQLQDDRLVSPTGETALSGTIPGGPAPVLDPALGKSVDGYREALANGDAKVFGDGSVNGRAVTWLQLAPTSWGNERVAIDKLTSEPVRVETSWNGGRSWAYDVRSIESLPEGSGDFKPPIASTAPQPQAFMREPMPIAPESAKTVLTGALALDTAFQGLPLTQVLETKLSTLYGPDAKRDPIVSRGVEFDYGSDSLTAGRPYLWLQEATQPKPQLGWRASLVPRRGRLLIRSGLGVPGETVTGLMVKNGIYITILASDRQLMLDAARALGPFSPSTP
jgi:hypothetical protein